MQRIALITATLALIAAAPAARAQPNPCDGAHGAQRLMDDAAAAAERGEHERAVELARCASALDPSPGLYRFIAIHLDALHRDGEALESARRCIAEVEANPRVRRRGDLLRVCRGILARAEARGAAAAADRTRPPRPSSGGPAAALPAPLERARLSLGNGGDCINDDGGRVLCWWARNFGGNHAPSAVEGIDHATDVVAGYGHACAIVARGHVRCWGDNTYGALGDGTTESRSAPVEVRGVERAVSIAVGREHSCVAREDGRVLCWGDVQLPGTPSSGALGNGTMVGAPVPALVADLGTVVQVVAASHYTCARLRDGTVRCWGYNQNGTVSPAAMDSIPRPTPIPDVSGAVQIAASSNGVCALREDGTVVCWGDGGNGLFGYEEPPRRGRVVTVPGLAGVTAIALADRHGCALRRDRSVVCWGDNEYARLGALRVGQPFRPRPISRLGPVRAVSAGLSHTCALRVNGAVQCWGLVGADQAGERVVRANPVAVPLAGL